MCQINMHAGLFGTFCNFKRERQNDLFPFEKQNVPNKPACTFIWHIRVLGTPYAPVSKIPSVKCKYIVHCVLLGLLLHSITLIGFSHCYQCSGKSRLLEQQAIAKDKFNYPNIRFLAATSDFVTE